MSSNAPLHEVGPGYPGLPIPYSTEISYQISAPGYETSEPRTIQVAPLKSVEISVKLAHGPVGQCRAQVTGKVVDESGASVSGALVGLLPAHLPDKPIDQQFFKTNEDGAFSASLSLDAPGTAPGPYWVLAKKEEAGYPDNVGTFYDDSQPPQVELLGCGASISDVVVDLGPKSAYISGVNVADAATGTTIEGALITLRRVHPPFSGPPPDVSRMSQSAHLFEVGLKLSRNRHTREHGDLLPDFGSWIRGIRASNDSGSPFKKRGDLRQVAEVRQSLRGPATASIR